MKRLGVGIAALLLATACGGTTPAAPDEAGGALVESTAVAACERAVHERIGGGSFKRGANWEDDGVWTVNGVVSAPGGAERGYTCEVRGPEGSHSATIIMLDDEPTPTPEATATTPQTEAVSPAPSSEPAEGLDALEPELAYLVMVVTATEQGADYGIHTPDSSGSHMEPLAEYGERACEELAKPGATYDTAVALLILDGVKAENGFNAEAYMAVMLAASRYLCPEHEGLVWPTKN